MKTAPDQVRLRIGGIAGRRLHSSAFTLIEILVATAATAILLIALYGVFS